MNSIHDMGGMDGWGPVRPEPNEPPFHERWEGRVLAMQRAMAYAGLGTIDQARAVMEALNPIEYLTVSYYKRWFLGLEHRIQVHGLVGADEIAAGRSLRPGKKLKCTLAPADVSLLKRGEFARPATAAPRFAAGDRVSTRNLNPTTHTRLPRYARDKIGTVEANRGCHVYPDSVAIGAGDPAITVSIEAFEPYLMPA